MASSSCRPVGITWEYDRVELIADGIVHVQARTEARTELKRKQERAVSSLVGSIHSASTILCRMLPDVGMRAELGRHEVNNDPSAAVDLIE